MINRTVPGVSCHYKIAPIVKMVVNMCFVSLALHLQLAEMLGIILVVNSTIGISWFQCSSIFACNATFRNINRYIWCERNKTMQVTSSELHWGKTYGIGY
jgi:hypothetical protein